MSIINIFKTFFDKKSALSFLETVDHTYHLFSSDIIENSGKKQFIVTTYKRLSFNILKSKTIPSFYENYELNQKIKFFIDIDYKITPENNNYKTIDELVNPAIEFINNIFSKYGYSNLQIIVLNATIPDKKLSAHIIAPTIIFNDIYHIRDFMTQFNYDFIDHEPYNKVGCMRIFKCQKLGKNNPLEFYKAYNYDKTDEKDILMDSLLLNVDNDLPVINFIYDENNNTVKPKKIKKPKNNNTDKSNKKTNKKNNEDNIDKNIYYDPYIDYCHNDNQLNELLDLLPDKYLNEYSEWIKILNIFKSIDKFELFDNWSKQSKKYNREENIKKWNDTKCLFNVNYLVYLVNENNNKHYKFFTCFKKYNSTLNLHNYEIINCHNYRVSNVLTDEIFNNYDTFMVRAEPGCGKTTCVAIQKAKTDHNIICIADKRSLVNQHLKTFKEYNINIKSYTETFDFDDNLCICINSLHKLHDLTDAEISNTILFVDEISSFLLLTHNDTLNNNIKYVYNILIRLVKNCHKLIVSDANINEQVIMFCNLKDSNKKVFINNTYKKFSGTKAIRINYENEFINKLFDKCSNNEYFLFASDNATKLTDIYKLCISKFNTIKDKFLLITKDSKYITKDANIEWKDKFVFFSPSIIYGIDFTIDNPQDVFIYINGGSLCSPLLYQQVTRCRNINNVYYFSCAPTYNTPHYKYKTYNDCYNIYLNCISYNEKLYSVCSEFYNYKYTIDNSNSFFELFILNEYMLDCYNSNLTYFFENILIEKEFILENYKEKLDVINNKDIDIDNTINEFNICENKIRFLNLPDDKNILDKYKNIISNDKAYKEHLNIILFLKSDKYLQDHFDNTFMVKLLKTTRNKIILCRNLMKKLNIDYFNIDNVRFSKNEPFEFDNNEWQTLEKAFNLRRTKPDNKHDVFKIVISLIRNITCNDFISSEQKHIKKEQFFLHKLNYDLIKFHLELYIFRNIYNIDLFHDHIYDKFNYLFPKIDYFI